LSKQEAVMSTTEMAPSQQLFASTLTFGGGGGDSFDDVVTQSPLQVVAIQSITICAGNSVDSIQTTYLRSDDTTWQSSNHGGNGGSPNNIVLDLNAQERVVAIHGRYGNRLDQLGLITEKVDEAGNIVSTTYGPFGESGGGQPFRFDGDIYGFFGGSGARLDRIGVYIGSPTQGLFGGGGGSFFCDPVLSGTSAPFVGIRKIVVRHGDKIDSLKTTYLQEDGSTVTCGPYGGSGGDPTTINLESGETIFATLVRSGDEVDSLTFLSVQKDGTRNTYGPYGGGGGSQTIINAGLLGFMGRSGAKLDAIGFFLQSPPTPEISVFGANGYRYCILKGNTGGTTSVLPVSQPNCSVSFQIQMDNSDNAASMVITAPDGTSYSSASNGNDGVWSTTPPGKSSGLLTFYMPVAMQGNWKALVTPANPTFDQWSVTSICLPGGDVRHIADLAFRQLSPAERDAIMRGMTFNNAPLPPEICFFCQAQMVTIMALAIATFYFWAGPVVATSAIVLYAERIFGIRAAMWVSSLNFAYGMWTKGSSTLQIVRWLCEQQSMCPRDSIHEEAPAPYLPKL
jgi:hypothetical protein